MVFTRASQIYSAADFSKDKKYLMKNYISSTWTCLVNMIVKRELYETNDLKSSMQL